MTNGRRLARDNLLLDKLDALPRQQRSQSVWRAVRDGRDPTQCNAPGGRWDDGTFDVLYTSEQAEGAVAEIRFHLSKGQPVFPSKVSYGLYELHVELRSCIVFADLTALSQLVDTSTFAQLSHADRQREYPRLQELAEGAFFLGADGLVVPSARWVCSNVVIFCERVEPGSIAVHKELGAINWEKWPT